MSNGQAPQTVFLTTYRELTRAQKLVVNMLIAAREALEDNPSPEDRRAIDDRILRLAEERHRIREKKRALRASRTVTKPPSDDQRRAIGELLREVEELTRDAVTASLAIGLAGKVLELASSIDFG